jgi:hypothetical protein
MKYIDLKNEKAKEQYRKLLGLLIDLTDQYTVEDIIYTLADVCSGKARDHYANADNPQSEELGDLWANQASELMNTECFIC